MRRGEGIRGGRGGGGRLEGAQGGKGGRGRCMMRMTTRKETRQS